MTIWRPLNTKRFAAARLSPVLSGILIDGWDCTPPAGESDAVWDVFGLSREELAALWIEAKTKRISREDG